MTQPVEDDRAPKRPRLGDALDSAQNGLISTSPPEVDRIKQSDSQISYLQAQLAATESLFAAYQAELQGLSKELRDVKRSHLRSGLRLWKVEGASAEAAEVRSSHQQQQRQQSPGAGPWDDDLETFSDIEEQVLLIQEAEEEVAVGLQGKRPSHEEQQQPQDDQEHADTAAGATSAPPPLASAGSAGLNIGGEGSAGATGDRSAATAAPATDAAAAASAGTASTWAASGVAAAAAVDKIEGASAAATAALVRLEALEAACSAVAQEDMEAQGALACLAGRSGKYYLRSTVVTLGRTTDSKGDVDLDLSPEEPPLLRGPTVAAAAAGTGAPTGVAAAGAGEQVEAGAGEQGLPAAALQPQPAGTAGAAAQAAAAGRGGHFVSRRQAVVRLGSDGQFRLVNTGRQVVRVNDVEVSQYHTVNLPHLSLIEVGGPAGGVRLLFLANTAAVARVVRRSAALSL